MDIFEVRGDRLHREVGIDRDVDVEITGPKGAKVKFRAGHFKIESTAARHSPLHRQHTVELERLTGVRFTGSDTPVPQEPPKYFACMGEAAQAYCDELNAAGGCSNFRWEEVWKRMWEVNQQGNPNLKEEEQK